MDLALAGKVFLVAGASRGLGYGVAEALAGEGAHVAIASRDSEAIAAAATQLQTDTGAEVRGYVMNAQDSASIQTWVDAVVSDFGAVHGLFVNAGGPPVGTFDAFDDSDWQSAFDLSLMSAVRMIRAALPALKAAGGGAILTSTSSSVKEPIDVLLLSNVMRAGVAGLAKSLSQSLAADHIRVNNIIPGLIATDRLQQIDEFAAQQKQCSVSEHQQHQWDSIPMGRYGRVDEFAKVATFLLSDAASYISGASVVVDGGKMKTVW